MEPGGETDSDGSIGTPLGCERSARVNSETAPPAGEKVE